MGALERTARRLKAGLAVLFLIALAAVLAPQDAQAQAPVLTATPGDGQVTLSWTLSSTGVGTKWGYKINGGGFTWAGTPIAIPGSNAGTRSHMVTGLTNGTSYQFIVYLQTATNTAYRQSGQVSATPNPPTAGVTLSKTSLTMNEGSSDTYTVKLDKAPTVNVTITVSGASGDVSVMGSPLTFTPSNFGTAQTITVSAARDGDTTDDTATLTHAASSTDTAYGASLEIDDVDVTVTDTTPTFQLLTDPAAVTEGTDISLTVTSDRSIYGNWPVRLTLAARSSSTFTAADIAGTLGPREFTANFGSTSAFGSPVPGTTGTVTIPTSTDSATEGAEAYRITLSQRTTFVSYAVGTDATADGTLNDAAATGPTITLTAAPGDRQVTLSWTYTNDDGEAFDHWRYAQKKGGGSYSGLGEEMPGGKTIRTHTVTGLENGAAYTFKVTRGVTSPPPVRIQTTAPPYSNEVTATPAGSPAAPTDLTAEAGNAQVTLSWTDPEDDSITRYNLRQKKGSAAWGSWTAIPGSDADTTTHTVTGLDNDVEYRFRIRARNSGGNSAQSAVVLATPTATAAVPKPVLSAEAGYARVTLSWSALSGVTVASWGYEYKSAGGSWSSTTTVTGGSTTSTTVTGLTIGTEYTFRLFAAVSPGVQSVWSDEVKATPTNTVPKPVLTAAGGDRSVTLSWSGLSGIPITSWGYQYKSSGGWSTTTTVTGGSRTGATVTGLTGGTEYTFRLFAAVSPGVQSVWSDEVTATPYALAAPVLTGATSNAPSLALGVRLTWTHSGDLVPSGATWWYWQMGHRLRGSTDWRGTARTGASAVLSARTVNWGLDTFYPEGAVVEVRIRGRGINDQNGLWSNIRTVTLSDDDDDRPALTITGAPVTVEPGSTATYTVALTKAYAGTLRVTSDDTAAATVSPPSLTFTTSNYNTARTVTVTGVGNGTATINHAFRLTGASADAIPDAGTVDVTVADAPGVTVSPGALRVAEGATGTYTVKLNTKPAGSVTVTPTSSAGTVATVSGALTFTTSTWGTMQTVTVSGVNNAVAGGDGSATVSHAVTGYGAVTTAASVTVTVTDDDAPGVTVSPGALTVAEGATGTYTVKLNTKPGGSVTVTPTSSAGTVATVSGALTFTTGTWETEQTVTVSGVNNAVAGGDGSATVSHAVTGYGAVSTAASVTVTVTDDDAAGVTVSDPTRSTITEAAGPAHTSTYTVGLATEPSGSVTVTVTPGAGVTVSPGALTFTTGTWGTGQTVTVTAVDDRGDDGASKAVTVAHRVAGGGAGYTGVSVRTLTFTVTDDDAPVPAKPAQLTATPGDGQVALAWADAEDASITGWQVRQQVGAGSYGAWSAIPGAGASTTSHTVTGLTNGTAYTFQVRAENRTGAGAASDGVTATPRGDDGSANAVHRTVLPQVAAVVVSQSLGVVADRIEAVAGGVAGGSLRLGAQPMAPGPVGGGGRRPVAGAGPSLAEVLDGVAFTLPLGSGEAGGLPPVAVWGRGERVAVAGSEDAVSWDGGLWGAHLGADVRLRPDLLAGVAVSYSLGELDAEHTGQTRTTRSTYETDLTAVQPYVAWLGADGSSLWASAGYGWGEVQLEEMGRAARQTDLTFASTAVGGRGVLGADAEWIAGGMTRLAIKGEGSLAWMETEAGAGLAGVAVDTRRLRLALQGSHERAVAGGATLTPAVEVGLRHDGGDATQGAGMEAGASLRYRDPGLGLTVEVRTRTLLVHERDREEWGVSGLVRLDPAADGRGLFLTLAPERGGTASGLGQLFARTPGAAQAPGGVGPVASRLAAELGHGFGVTGFGQQSVVTPYAGVTLVERGERHWRLGTRYRVGGLELSLEAARRASRTTPAADSLMIQAGLQW